MYCLQYVPFFTSLSKYLSVPIIPPNLVCKHAEDVISGRGAGKIKIKEATHSQEGISFIIDGI